MRRVFLFLLFITFCLSARAQESEKTNAVPKKQSVGYASRDATVLSMMGWGVGIFAGIATLFALLENNTEAEGTGGHSH